MPAEPKFNWPGFDFASAITSLTDLTGNCGDTTSTFGSDATCVTQTISSSGRYGGSFCSSGCIRCGWPTMPSV